MSRFYSFFANLGVGWVNTATVVGAIIGIVISVYAIWFSKKLSDEGVLIADAIKKNIDATQVLSESTHKHAKILRLDQLRNLYELSRGQDTYTYWHFRWRFETYNCLRIQIQKKEGSNLVILGHCAVLIQGFSNAAGPSRL